MRFIFHFPDIGEGITEGKIIEWYVSKGQTVSEGEHIVKMETDKVVTDIPSPREGKIVQRFGNEGDVINVDDALVEIEIEGVAGEEAQTIAASKPKGKTTAGVEETGFGVVGSLEVAGDAAFLPASEEGQNRKAISAKTSTKAKATPVARALAKDLGVDINSVNGSGPGGRVMKRDIIARNEAQRSGSETGGTGKVEAGRDAAKKAVEYVELSQIRKAIARQMSISKNTAAHMTVYEEVEVSRLRDLRQKNKERFAERGAKLTYMPFIVKAVVESLRRHADLNAELDLEKHRIVRHHNYHIGLAVDAPDGLVVPVIRNAESQSIFELAQTIADLATRAQKRQLELNEVRGSTFTITNFGTIAGIHGTPVINYPEVAILGLGRILDTPVVRNGELAVGTILPLSLSVDHRLIDGGEAVRFLADMKQYLADPVSLLLL
jgi:pyruvate dehydrogenase E2 component (dihydrolipoamide acetyltransferase)